MITKKFKREDLINDIVGIFSFNDITFTPAEIRSLFEQLDKFRQIHVTYDFDPIINILEDYELLICVEVIDGEYADKKIFRYIPTPKLIDNWVSYMSEIEKRTLDHIPFKGMLEEYAKNLSVDISWVKKDTRELMQLENYDEKLERNPLYDLLQDFGIINYDFEDGEYKKLHDSRGDGSDRWYSAFIYWLNN